MKKLIKIGLILFGVGLFAALGVYLYVFHKPHRNIAKEEPAYILKADQLVSEFTTNEEAGYAKYGDMVVQISGEVVEKNISEKGASLVYVSPMEGVSCTLDSITALAYDTQLKQLSVGDEFTLKGKVDGYDFIMGVVISRCVPVF